ncbi:NAD(P)-dependent oxidoreductase [Desulfosporosinus sp. FKA]|uniref:NAD-dependent epimerase/dehydratase family protein n=1 Tax=Desulfosporosinus sp. FKA TaxID=1969834 RepID=UPI000B497B94|nr:NAD(P)-dependent oxidoreductase [Desulfosporosinus sp. FKA]
MIEILKVDLQSIVSDNNIPWDELKNSSVLITGATGLIGGMLIRALNHANATYKFNIRLIACGRDKAKFDALGISNAEFISADIRDFHIFSSLERVDYIFHCAAITKSADMVEKPVDVMTTSVDGTRNMLEFARKKGCKSFIYLSSMEVYGQNLDGEVTEQDLGNIDLSNSRSCYPESKRFCEMLCVSFAKQYGLNIKIARLAQTFGAATPKDDTRVFAQFARSAINGENIVLHTEGKSRGNYCYTADAVCGLFTLLLKGNNCEAYNISNPETSMTIREMAELVASTLGNGKSKVVVDIPKENLGYAPTVEHKLNIDKITALGWQPKYGLKEMYLRLAEDWA